MLHPVLTVPADEATLDAVNQVYATVMAMSRRRRRKAEARYDAVWEQEFRTELAGQRANDIARTTGRLDQTLRTGVTVWDAIETLCGQLGGAADVAEAVLTHDLLDPPCYHRLTRWWIDAGLQLPLPDPAITAWDAEVAGPGGPLPGSYLTDRRYVWDGLEYTVAGASVTAAHAAVSTIALAVRCAGARIDVDAGSVVLHLFDDIIR